MLYQMNDSKNEFIFFLVIIFLNFFEFAIIVQDLMCCKNFSIIEIKIL